MEDNFEILRPLKAFEQISDVRAQVFKRLKVEAVQEYYELAKISLFEINERKRSPDGSLSILHALLLSINFLLENTPFSKFEQSIGVSHSTLHSNLLLILEHVRMCREKIKKIDLFKIER